MAVLNFAKSGVNNGLSSFSVGFSNYIVLEIKEPPGPDWALDVECYYSRHPEIVTSKTNLFPILSFIIVKLKGALSQKI